MLSETEILNTVRQTTEMGVDGIKLIIDDTNDNDFHNELKRQLIEYDEIYKQADSLLDKIGGEKKDVKATVKIATHLSGKMKYMSGSTSKIAESMIEGSTMGVTKVLKLVHDCNSDSEAKKIAEKLVKTEENNIEQLKKFL
jgi:hypothetical protein